MGLLLFSPSLSSASYPSSPSMAITATPMSRLQKKCIGMQPKSFNGVQNFLSLGVQERGAVIVQASSDIDGIGSESAESAAEGKEENVSIETLPLESKLQMMHEQKLRMKLAKKIRLRRKRLVKKRRIRKKNKNV